MASTGTFKGISSRDIAIQPSHMSKEALASLTWVRRILYVKYRDKITNHEARQEDTTSTTEQ